MAKVLAGKVALITGSTEGIGLGIARKFGQDGASVVISGRREEMLNKAVKSLQSEGIKCIAVQGHVGHSDQRKELFNRTKETFGGVDIFVHNAGTNPVKASLEEMEESKWDHVMNVNLKSAMSLTKMCVPEMTKRGGGSIIYTSTQTAHFPGMFSKSFGYCVSKMALESMVEQLCPQLGPDNIGIHAVIVGLIDTTFARPLIEHGPTNQRVREGGCIKRFGTPEDVGNLCSFLTTESGKLTTGSAIPFYGGWKQRELLS